MTNTIQELRFIKHTAWMNANRPHRGATKEEANRITPYVIGAVVYTAVLNGLMYDLIDTLKDERQYNDRAKKVLRMLQGGEKYYNIVLTLLRLIEKNNAACGRFRSPALEALQPFIRRVTEIGLPYEDPWRVPTRKLPTKNQLKIVAEHIEEVNKHLNANGGYELRCLHWTNEEYDELRARGVGVIDGYTCADYKDLDYYVRAVTDMKV